MDKIITATKISVASAGGCVPENGSQVALSVAKYVTRSNNDGCIAHAIEILNEIY